MFGDSSDKKFIVSEQNEIGFKGELYDSFIADGEEVLLEFMSAQNVVVFTNRKFLGIRIEAYTARHKVALSIPYDKVTAASVEVSDNAEMDTEMRLWVPGLNCIVVKFLEDTIDMKKIVNIIANHIR